MSLAALVEHIEASADAPRNDLYLVAENRFFERPPLAALLAEIHFPPGWLDDERLRADGASLWLGGAPWQRRAGDRSGGGSRFPRARYVAPFYNAMGPVMLALLPTFLTDLFFRRAAGLVATPAAPASSAGNATVRGGKSAANEGAGVANAPS